MKKRPNSHIIDTAGAQLLRRVLPDAWVVREYQPDYGIDFAVEAFDSYGGSFVSLGGVTRVRHEYGLIEALDRALCHWRSRLESSRTANIFPSWWGSLYKVIVLSGDGHAVSM
jgi:hypothetical protein